MQNDYSSELVLSVLIVNFNGINFLDACINSIRKHVEIPYEIIVVDNASHDGSVDYLKNNHPSVKVVASAVNLGFTGGNNLAAKHAIGRYFLLLNNDTIIDSPVQPLIDFITTDAQVGVIGCRLIYGDGRQQESVGYMPSVLSLVFSWTPLTRLFHNSAKYRRTVRGASVLYNQRQVEVEWVSGAFLLTPANLWQRLGGLDEQYFMYMEDTDYCHRVRDLGSKVLYSADCRVIHFEGAGRSWIGERAVLNSSNSYIIYVRKFHGESAVVLLRMLLSQVFFARSMGHYIASLIGKDANGKEKSRAYIRAGIQLFLGSKH